MLPVTPEIFNLVLVSTEALGGDRNHHLQKFCLLLHSP